MPVANAVSLARTAFEENSTSKWIIGFSGGKDSSAMLKILVSAYIKAQIRPENVSIIYCDTGVENPILDRYVKTLLSDLDAEFISLGLPFTTHLLKAPIEDRFFVKVIGRGYPTPTNMFRWCTDKLRVKPVTNFIRESAEKDAIVCLGLRQFESQQRDRTLEKYGNEIWQTKNTKNYSYRTFFPVLGLSVSDVWDVIFMGGKPTALDAQKLEKIYRGASGECPVLKPPQAAPCGSGRFGCWTCTVVRKDKSMIALIEGGHEHLKPYLEFRNWIAAYRDNKHYRWRRRRNGVEGLGPFTLEARKEILDRLLKLSINVGEELISQEELVEIERLWEMDRDKEFI